MKTFDNLGINQNFIDALKKEEIHTPTEIQEKAISLILENKDVIGQSKTGSGKTLAFLLPLVQKLDTDSKDLQVIILTPTHELAIQIQRQIERLRDNSNTPIRSLPIIGNVNIKRQIDHLKDKPHIIVGSTGRIHELIKLRKIKAHTVKTIVIDEADRLLDKNNLEGVKDVIKTTFKERQLLMFSATLPEETINLAKEMMKEPLTIKIQEKETVSETIDHMYFMSEKREKAKVLRSLISAINPNRAIVFINDPDEVELILDKLRYHKYKVEAIHGTRIKSDRKKAIDDFKKGKVNILIASDIAARGLHIEDVTHIINMDIPFDPKSYIHRAGRTGRAGKSGYCISIVTENEKSTLKKYEQRLGIKIKAKDLSRGKVIDFNPKKARVSRVNKPFDKPKDKFKVNNDKKWDRKKK